MLIRSVLALVILTIQLGYAPAIAGYMQLSGNEHRIVVPRAGSMDPKVYPVEPQRYKPYPPPIPERDLRPSPDTGYGTPGSPLISPGQTIPGRSDSNGL